MGSEYSTYGERRGVYRVLVGKQGERPLGRPRHRWKDIKMDILEVGCEGLTGSSWLRIRTGGGHL